MRIQILSILANEYSYAAIAKFNPKNYKDTSSVKPEERDEERAEEEALLDQERGPLGLEQVVDENICFLYPVSRYIFRKARSHYHQNKHAFAPLPKSKITRWHWDLHTVVNIIITAMFNTKLISNHCPSGKYC